MSRGQSPGHVRNGHVQGLSLDKPHKADRRAFGGFHLRAPNGHVPGTVPGTCSEGPRPGTVPGRAWRGRVGKGRPTGGVQCCHGDSRLETFSDGVFAIAATLLILEVHRAPGSVTHGLVHAWPSYVAYAISFLTIGIIWVNHHT